MSKITIGQSADVYSPPKMAAVGIVVARACRGCGAKTVNEYGQPLKFCAQCGTPVMIEDHGDVAYWHKNPLMRLAYALSRPVYWVKRLYWFGRNLKWQR